MFAFFFSLTCTYLRNGVKGDKKKKIVLIPMDVDLRIHSFLNGRLHSEHRFNNFKENQTKL